MEGITISKMAKKLNLPKKTVEMRLLRRGHKPKSQEAIYSMDAFEDSKNVPGKGRPEKAAPDPEPAKPRAKKPAKPKK